ncbi:MAG: DNA-binding response regulator [Planctomycetia bacterium 21-64-5]|nr:MAG: DNA-binding response regulator [Planctomycetia bacterium 21-64-5]HQU43868.1 response regulator transcription factor [Pirellulales bacterium]
MAIKVVIVDDHEVVRTGIVSLFEDTEVKVVGQAANGADAVQVVKSKKPDVVLLDIRMTDGDGLMALEELRQAAPNCRVVMLSTYDNPTYVARANAMGASDYLLKGSSRDQLLNAIRAVAAGDAPSAFGEMRRVAGAMATRQKDDAEPTLTQRETQVLRHLALGLSNKEIGRSLSISIETVKEHVQHLLRKIDATDRTQAAVWAVKKKLV